jgi:hypothetical protein
LQLQRTTARSAAVFGLWDARRPRSLVVVASRDPIGNGLEGVSFDGSRTDFWNEEGRDLKIALQNVGLRNLDSREN